MQSSYVVNHTQVIWGVKKKKPKRNMYMSMNIGKSLSVYRKYLCKEND